MKYIEWIPSEEDQDLKSESPEVRHFKNMVIGILSHIIPKANPDFENEYNNVKKWWVEIDNDGLPSREIGFDINGKAIVIGPINDNFGMVTDSPLTFDSESNAKHIENKFQLVWRNFEDKFDKKKLGRNHK